MRQLARTIKSNSIKFQKASNPVIVLGLRRGGTTMVADAIAANKGVWFSNEPFAVLPAHPAYEKKLQLLPHRMHSHYFSLHGEDEKRFSEYLDMLFSATLKDLGTSRRPKFPFKADRVCLKVLNAPWMIDWLKNRTDAQIVPILRHPAAQALSVLRQNWGFPVEAYFQSRNLLAEEFSSDQWHMMEQILGSEDSWRLAVLDYAVTSKKIRESSGLGIFKYEDIVISPERFIDSVLIDRLGFLERSRMLETFRSPSGSAKMSIDSVNSAIRAGEKYVIVNRWKSEVTREMKESGQAILDKFEIGEYSFFEA